jgi:hypothetical protein
MSSQKTSAGLGYKATNDPYVRKNGDSTITQRPGQGTIINNGGRSNTYEANPSQSFLKERLKKK